MALIKCPECGQDVSDKAEVCIHCGYPLKALKEEKPKQNRTISLNGKICDAEPLYQIIDKYKMGKATMGDVKQIAILFPSNNGVEYADYNLAFCNVIAKTLAVPESFTAKTEEEKKAEELIPHCPKCGSKSIEVTQRGYSLLTGFLGSGKAMNYCKNCGYRWRP